MVDRIADCLVQSVFISKPPAPKNGLNEWQPWKLRKPTENSSCTKRTRNTAYCIQLEVDDGQTRSVGLRKRNSVDLVQEIGNYARYAVDRWLMVTQVWWDPMYVGMDKRLFRLGESICGLFRGAHIDSQALKHSSTLDIVYSTLRFKWSIYCPFRVLLSANSLVQLVLRLPQFIPLSKRPLSGCRTSEFRFKRSTALTIFPASIINCH